MKWACWLPVTPLVVQEFGEERLSQFANVPADVTITTQRRVRDDELDEEMRKYDNCIWFYFEGHTP